MPTQPTQPAANQSVYQLKVTLMHGEPPMPPIWRKIQVPSDIRLPRLHKILQTVMGWENYHLHQFVVGAIHQIYEADRSQQTSYGIPDPDFESETIDERSVKLSRLVALASDKAAKRAKPAELDEQEQARAPGRIWFIYEYDFGDGWEHEVIVEEVLPQQEEVNYPICLGGGGACPPEDVGGIGGYTEFLEVIANSKHPEHKAMLRWAGGRFDPKAFDLEKVNQRLGRRR